MMKDRCVGPGVKTFPNVVAHYCRELNFWGVKSRTNVFQVDKLQNVWKFFKQIHSLANVLGKNNCYVYRSRPAGTALDAATDGDVTFQDQLCTCDTYESSVRRYGVTIKCVVPDQLSQLLHAISCYVFWPGSRLDDRQSRTDRFFLKFPSLGCGGDVAILLAARCSGSASLAVDVALSVLPVAVPVRVPSTFLCFALLLLLWRCDLCLLAFVLPFPPVHPSLPMFDC